MIEIRYCALNEVAKLRDFINREWKENHILSASQLLLDWQHKDTGRYNFVVAYDSETDNFLGILGFIPVSRYDAAVASNMDIWLALWKALKTDCYPALGFKLMDFLVKDYQPRSIGAIGMNKEVRILYKFMKYKLGSLSHYYLLNRERHTFHIAAGVEGTINTGCGTEQQAVIEEITDLGSVSVNEPVARQPAKSITYLVNRYQQHPIYQYRFFGIYTGNVLQLIWVVRKVHANDSSCLRIIDMYGNFSIDCCLAENLQLLLQKEDSEYIDCLNYGLSERFFGKMGFTAVREPAVIPNFFEPFVQANVPVDFGIRPAQGNYIIFKGDSDQDRPSII